MKIWNDEEVKELFGEVENCKHGQTALKNAFCLHAKKYKRKPNSVRNYYYHEVENLKNDGARCKNLNIDLSKHDKTHFKNFDKTRTKKGIYPSRRKLTFKNKRKDSFSKKA